MNIDRRGFLAGSAVALITPPSAFAQADAIFAPAPGGWRTFDVTTRLEILMPEGATQAWIPVAGLKAPDWTQPKDLKWGTNGAATLVSSGADMLHVQWDAKVDKPYIEITNSVATRDRAIDLKKPGAVAPLSEAERKLYLASTDLVPLDGIVKHTADRVIGFAKTDMEKARAIYEWVVDNSYRRASTRGCGTGDVAGLLKSGDLGGKCADLNALFVGLARAAGIPARDVYGLRIAPSKFGYKSLGANSEMITKAQHCRAEVFLDGFGWVPMDPADVRKVILEEPPGNLAVNDAKVTAARKALFGSWETNWLAYNTAHDVVLPGSKVGKVGFLMYPECETNGARLDPLDPDNFKYTIRTKETTSA